MDLCEGLRQCIVKIEIKKTKGRGTGFFISPGSILTCAHVVESARKSNDDIEIHYKNTSFLATINYFSKVDYPDISILKINYFEHPCVFLLEYVSVGDRLYGFGYPKDYPTGDSFTVEYEGPTGDPVLHKLKQGQILRGMSGSPLLNLSTGAVCGFVKKRRSMNDESELGGRAISSSEIFSATNELRENHYSFHEKSKYPWLDLLTTSQWNEIRNRVVLSNLSNSSALKKIIQRKKDTSIKTCVSKLPATSEIFFGREEHLAVLDAAWVRDETNIFCLVGWGGVGKTAFVNKWLNQMKAENYKDALRVYAWSFHSQGASESKQTSTDPFFNEILKWFEEPNPEKIKNKGVYLADLVRREKTLLILDGLEPLQYPSGPDEGRIKDLELEVFLKELSAHNSGLCIITSRISIKGFVFHAPTVTTIVFDGLSGESGIMLLQHYGIQGNYKEFSDAVEEFGGHALTLNLLGALICAQYKGDERIGHYKNIEKFDKLVHERISLGKNASRVLKSYENWLKTTQEGRQGLNLLYILGLFDRPAPLNAIKAVIDKSSIDGLTTELQNLSYRDLNFAIDELIKLRLVLHENQDETYDCHPLVREHFSERLLKNNPTGWKEANNRLFEFYKALPLKEFPDTFGEMEPLFQAVTHGCQAGRFQETLENVYWKRILREQEHYAIHVLGTINDDLAALSNFFIPCNKPWQKVFPELEVIDQNAIFFFAGYDLRALGRLKEAIRPLEEGFKSDKEIKDWRNAAISAGYLSELYLTLGDVKRAEKYARESIGFPKPENEINSFMQRTRLSDSLEKLKQKYRLANVLHQAGNFKESEFLFREAETEQKKIEPDIQFVHSLSGFWFCDLLLSIGKYDEVITRAEYTIKFSEKKQWLREIALDKLSLGRALMLISVKKKTYDFSQAEIYLNQAVNELTHSKQIHYLPFGFLSRATLNRFQRNISKAKKDLYEVKEIAQWETNGEWHVTNNWPNMGIFLVDYYLEFCRLLLREGNKQEALKIFPVIKEKIPHLGYHRRDIDVKKLDKVFSNSF